MANRSILVVDDEPLVLQATARTLRLAGHDVHTAAGLADALAVCEEYSLDVIIVDFMMPGVHGLELLARIRKIQPNVKSIVVSGKLDLTKDETLITTQLREQVEADLYLHKPVAGRKILDAIEGLFDMTAPADWQKMAAAMITPEKTSIGKAKKAAANLPKKKKRGQ
jgi:CheY-like chemotaxis protein